MGYIRREQAHVRSADNRKRISAKCQIHMPQINPSSYSSITYEIILRLRDLKLAHIVVFCHAVAMCVHNIHIRWAFGRNLLCDSFIIISSLNQIRNFECKNPEWHSRLDGHTESKTPQANRMEMEMENSVAAHSEKNGNGWTIQV